MCYTALSVLILIVLIYALHQLGYITIPFRRSDSFSNRLWTAAERSYYTGEPVGLVKMPIINNYKQLASTRGVFGVPAQTLQTKDPRVISSYYKSGLGDPETLIPPADF